MNKPALKNLKDKPYGGAQYVDDPNLKQWVKDTAIMIAEEEPWFDEDIHIKFLNRYREWLLSSKENYFVNLDWFEHSAFSLGTSEAFDKFYMKHSNRRFRCLPGEYMYHQASFRNFFPDWRFIDEDNPIKRTDALVVSMPFSDGTEPFMKEIFNECSHLQVPILLDCAYMGICRNYVFELNYPTIEAVTFSLSKFLPVPHFRIGMRLTKEDDDDSVTSTTEPKQMAMDSNDSQDENTKKKSLVPNLDLGQDSDSLCESDHESMADRKKCRRRHVSLTERRGSLPLKLDIPEPSPSPLSRAPPVELPEPLPSWSRYVGLLPVAAAALMVGYQIQRQL